MVRSLSEYTNTPDGQTVALPPQRQALETAALQRIGRQAALTSGVWAWGSLPDTCRRQVFRYTIQGRYGQLVQDYQIETVPNIYYEQYEPVSILLAPDALGIARLLTSENPHLYCGFEQRQLCVHLPRWEARKSTIAEYILNAVANWVNNFTAMVATNGTWRPSKWWNEQTGGGHA